MTTAFDARPLSDYELLIGEFSGTIPDAGSETIKDPEGVKTVFPTQGYGYITGTVKADRAVTVSIYQGHKTTVFPKVTTGTHSGTATDGAGLDFSVKVCARFAKIVISNATGSAATVDCSFSLSKGTV